MAAYDKCGERRDSGESVGKSQVLYYPSQFFGALLGAL